MPFLTHRGDTVQAKQFYVERPGEQYFVTVVHVPNGPVTDDALVEHAAGQLAPYKRPRRIHFVDELPRNALGKVLRHELARQAQALGGD